jgi:hypothetical protein
MMSIKPKKKTLITKQVYVHLTRNSLIGFILITIALYIGMLGYHLLEKMPWMDVFLNASMILSGMGPAAVITTSAGKLFAGLYALFSGLTFITLVVMMLSPLIHAFFHRLHLESSQDENT